MKIPKFNKHDPVNIIWLDIYDIKLSSWADDEEIMMAIDKEDTFAKSRGYFYCIYKKYIYIYGDKLDNTYSRLTGIPIGAIIKINKGR